MDHHGRLGKCLIPPWAGFPYPGLIKESFGAEAPTVLRRYPLQRYHNNAAIAWSAVFTDRIWACSQVATAGVLARFTPVYTYEFADEHAQPLATLPPRFPAGASHGSELMDLFDVTGRLPITSSHYTPAQRRLADTMITYWTTFARTGQPSSATVPSWPVTRPGHPNSPPSSSRQAPAASSPSTPPPNTSADSGAPEGAYPRTLLSRSCRTCPGRARCAGSCSAR
jgi:hypothetical protein